jgi:hypothetical protein
VNGKSATVEAPYNFIQSMPLIQFRLICWRCTFCAFAADNLIRIFINLPAYIEQMNGQVTHGKDDDDNDEHLGDVSPGAHARTDVIGTASAAAHA